MAIWLPERDVWTSQPNGIVSINRTNPLSRHLVFAWTGPNTYHRNLAGTKHHGTTVGSIPPERGTCRLGNSVSTKIDLGSVTSADALSGYPSSELSVFALGFATGWGSASSGWGRIIDKSNSGLGAGGWCIYINNFGRLLVSVNGADRLSSATSRVSLNRLIAYGVDIKSGNLNMYFDGALLDSGADTFTWSTTTTNAAIGNWNHSTSREWQGYLFVVLVFDKLLSPEQHLALSKNPWQIFE